MSELNLDDAICSLVLKALNKHKHKDEAAKALGVSGRQMYNYIQQFNIGLSEPKWIKKKEQKDDDTRTK